jgi:uncharacterized protein (TIGR04255 family)
MILRMISTQRVSRKLAKAPLVHVITQVRFASVLSMGQSVARIQERLKEMGFVRFQKSQIQNISFVPGSPPKVEAQERWDFTDRDRQTGIVLAQDFVALHTSKYETFDVFGELFGRAVQIVSTEAPVELAERMGIRYVDLIRPGKDETLEDYLHPGLLGFPFSELKDEPIGNWALRNEAVVQTTQGTLIVRCTSASKDQFLPPDLMPPVLEYNVRLEADERAAILDTDHFAIVDKDFKAEALLEQLDLLHQTASKVFRIAVTESALRNWGGP